jgi:phage terminase large subunit
LSLTHPFAPPAEAAPTDNPVLDFMLRYRDDWPGLVRHVFEAEPDAWQEEALVAVQNGERRLSIRSGHGVGKTAM